MGKDLRIFTTPFKDELISSFLQRNSELRGGYKNDKYKITAVDVYLGNRKVDDFFERYPFDDLMENHTLLPLSRRFQSLQRIRSFPGPIAPIIHLKVCWVCVVDDYASLGTPYFHRQHAVTGVWQCYRHKTLLMSRCNSCSRPVTQHDFEGLYRCSQEIEIAQELSCSDEGHKFSNFVHELITVTPEVRAFYRLRMVIRDRLIEQGFEYDGKIDFKKIEFTLRLMLDGHHKNGVSEPVRLRSFLPHLSTWTRLTYLAFGTSAEYLSFLRRYQD